MTGDRRPPTWDPHVRCLLDRPAGRMLDGTRRPTNPEYELDGIHRKGELPHLLQQARSRYLAPRLAF